MYLGGDLFKVDNKTELTNLQTMLGLTQYAATGAGQLWSSLVKVAWQWNTNTAGNIHTLRKKDRAKTVLLGYCFRKWCPFFSGFKGTKVGGGVNHVYRR